MASYPALPHPQLLCQRQKTISGLFINTRVQDDDVSIFLSMADMANNNKNTTGSKLLLTFLPHKQIKILATTKCDILHCRNDDNFTSTSSYYVCKPTTKQWRTVPNPNPNPNPVSQRDPTEEIYAMVVLNSKPNLHFKIVRFSQINTWWPSVDFRCEIFDSKTSEWKELLNTITVSSFPSLPSVSACGGGEISWLLPYKQIFDFNLVDESWRVVALPHSLTENKDYCRKTMKLVEYKGQMALICVVAREQCLELWVNGGESGRNVWNKRHKVCLKEILESEEFVYPYALYENDIVVLMDNENWNVVFYNFGDYTFKVVNLIERFCHTTTFFHLESDSESLEF